MDVEGNYVAPPKPSLWERTWPKIKRGVRYYGIAHFGIGLLRTVLLGDIYGIPKGPWEGEIETKQQDSLQVGIVLPYAPETGVKALLTYVDMGGAPYLTAQVMGGDHNCAQGVGYRMLSPHQTGPYEVQCAEFVIAERE